MSVERFEREVATASYAKNDRIWFPRWIRRYAGSVGKNKRGQLPVAKSDVVRFLRSLRDNSVPAWQRLQAARAVEAYRDLILRISEPSFVEIRQTLQRLASDESTTGVAKPPDERKLVGRLDPKEPAVIRDLRAELRLMHYARDTEKAYGADCRGPSSS